MMIVSSGNDTEGRLLSQISELQAESENLQNEIIRLGEYRKMQEDELLKCRDFIEQCPSGICEVDINSRRVVEVNNKLAEVLGYSKAELRGLEFEKLFAEEDKQLISDYIGTPSAGGSLPEVKEWGVRSKDGQLLWFLLGARLSYEEGNQVRAFFVFTPISVLKRFQFQLQQSQKLEAIGTLAGGVAHDFNNLLMVILGNLSLFRYSNTLDTCESDLLEKIETAIKTGVDLTRRLLSYAQKGKYHVERIDMNNLVQECLAIGRARQDIIIRTEMAENLWPIDGDKEQIEQVFVDLIINAFEAMPSGGVLTLRAKNVKADDVKNVFHGVESHKPYVLVEISDTGIGMDEDTLKRVFDPFYSTKGWGSNSGLGLAGVYGIVKNHDGFISVSSKKDSGTEFRILFPTQRAASADEKGFASESHNRNKTVLVVDDEELVLHTAELMLTRIGHDAICANSGQQAIDQFQKHRDNIDLVLLDLGMPGISPASIMKTIKSIRPDVRVIISSGFSKNEIPEELQHTGGVGFLGKPYTTQQLAAIIQENTNIPCD